MSIPPWAAREIENGDAVKQAWRSLVAHNPDIRLCGGRRSRALWEALDTLAGIPLPSSTAERLDALEQGL